jgi:hypothetical protein
MSKWTSSCILAASTVLPAVAAAQQVSQQDPSAAPSYTQPSSPSPRAAQDTVAYRASKLIGARLDDARGEEIGEIDDLVISADGNVGAVVVSVGGVLDIGDRLVAAHYEELRVNSAGELYLPMTKQELAARPAYDGESVANVLSAQPPAREPVDPATAAEAQAEAQRSFAGNDPRVSVGIAENKEAYDEDSDPSDKR